jgi:hypothetical protein
MGVPWERHSPYSGGSVTATMAAGAIHRAMPPPRTLVTGPDIGQEGSQGPGVGLGTIAA